MDSKTRNGHQMNYMIAFLISLVLVSCGRKGDVYIDESSANTILLDIEKNIKEK